MPVVRSLVFQLRMSPEEHSKLARAAEISGMTMTDYVRAMVLPAAEALTSRDERRFMDALNQTGRTIVSRMNQPILKDCVVCGNPTPEANVTMIGDKPICASCMARIRAK